MSKNIGGASLFEGGDANEGVEKTCDASHHYERDPQVSNRHQDGADLKGLAAVLHELHGLPIGVQYAALATVVIIVIASLIAGCYMVSHF